MSRRVTSETGSRLARAALSVSRWPTRRRIEDSGSNRVVSAERHGWGGSAGRARSFPANQSLRAQYLARQMSCPSGLLNVRSRESLSSCHARYWRRAELTGWSGHLKDADQVNLTTGLIACSWCGVVAREPYPPNACLYFFQCRECGSVTPLQPGDGCVFRSFGSPRECPCFPSDPTVSKLAH